ncbi:hypothetical protein ABNQ39_00405 (plasmid) [Azospirillum sp. A26]|uniref:hypothetical protein n=1 Tax=Azospirillum sp. A26 TaxID=3160607 RepID=UPI00366B1E16
MNARLNVLPTLSADGLRGVREHADFGSRSLAECERDGDQQGADLWRRHTDRWLGKLADLMAS